MDYLIHLLILVCIYTMLAQSLSLGAGFTGMVSLAHAGFWGVGAYTAAILATRYDAPLQVSMPAAMVCSGALAATVSFAVLRTIEDYFIVCTLGIQVILFSFMNNAMDLTRGPLGIAGIPPASLFGRELKDGLEYLMLTAAVTTLLWLLMRNISRSGFGRILLTIQEDELFAASAGRNVRRIKTWVFTFSAMLASVPGVLYAHYFSYIDPTSFTVAESIFILSIVIIGGVRQLKGIFLAAAFMVLLPELLRFIGIPDNLAAHLRQIVYGVLLVVVTARGLRRNSAGQKLMVNTPPQNVN